MGRPLCKLVTEGRDAVVFVWYDHFAGQQLERDPCFSLQRTIMLEKYSE